MKKSHLAILVSALCLLGSGKVRADVTMLADLSLEELVKMEVTSVSRKAQRLSDTAAAVTVLSREDIRRTGARNIPEALRAVPGVEVAQIGAGRWAVSIRGFNGRFANKLLVQLDGRSVYTPTFSGVFWENIAPVMEDIERIEVVRGPGAALWGANAVNGVINIVTRKAAATRGTMVSASVDDRGRPEVAARYGFSLADNLDARLYARSVNVSPAQNLAGDSLQDRQRGWHAGFRIDRASVGSEGWSVQGEVFDQQSPERDSTTAGLENVIFSYSGGHLLGVRSWAVGNGEARLQAYADQQTLQMPQYGRMTVQTADLDFQHQLAPIGAHELIWGLGWRSVAYRIDLSAPFFVSLEPDSSNERIISAFVQDEITLVPRQWKLLLGARLEDNSLSGFEPQPNVRLLWTPTEVDSMWTQWSRASRTPSIGEAYSNVFYGIDAKTGLPLRSRVSASDPLDAERLSAFELGYRRQLSGGSVEVVAYHHRYDGLFAEQYGPVVAAPPGSPWPAEQMLYRNNVLNADSVGLELSAEAQVSADSRVSAAYTVKDVSARMPAGLRSRSVNVRVTEMEPHHTLVLQYDRNLNDRHSLGVTVRKVGAISAGIDGYTATDLRYGWRPSRSLRFSAEIQNLFDPAHPEFISDDFFPAEFGEVPRRLLLKAVWTH